MILILLLRKNGEQFSFIYFIVNGKLKPRYSKFGINTLIYKNKYVRV